MSVHGDINIVDNAKMSYEGSVHSPLIVSSTGTPVQSPVVQQVIPIAGSPLRPQSLVSHVAPTMQSQWLGGIAPQVLGLATSGSILDTVAPTEPVEVPTLQDTKVAFSEVSSAFQDILAKHGQIQGNIQALANTIEALRQAKQEE